MNSIRTKSLMTSTCKSLTLHAMAVVLLAFVTTSVANAQTVAYTGATIETMGDAGRIENATMVVSDGKITDIGVDIEIPDDARVVSLAGKSVMPGIVDPYFVFKRSAANSSRTIVFNGRTFTIPGRANFTVGAFTRAGEFFDPFDFNFKPAQRTGITSANLVSDGRGLSAIADLTNEASPEMLFKTDGHLFAMLTNQTLALDVIRKPLEPPKKPTANAKKKSTTTDEKKKLTSAEEIKKLWEAVRNGESKLFVNMNNEAAVAYVLQFAKKNEKLKVVLVATGANLYQSLDEIDKNKNITVVLQPGIDTVPFSRNLMNVSQMLAEREVPFCISMSLNQSQMTASQDDPMFPIAMLVKTGLSRDHAMQNITIKPAELMGIEKTHGSLEKDKHANFLIFDGDPLNTGSRLQQVFLNGNKIHEN